MSRKNDGYDRETSREKKKATDCSQRFFPSLQRHGGPRYHAVLEPVCRIREKLNANGDGI